MTANLVPIGKKYQSEACTRCACRASGIVHGHNGGTENVSQWDDPPPDCDCTCHAAWRMAHGRPASAEVAA